MNDPTDYSARLIFNCGQSESDLYLDNISLSFKDAETFIEPISGIPVKYKLYNNYPNPFNNLTTFKYQLKEQSIVDIKIFNLLGEITAEYKNLPGNEGIHTFNWDATSFSSGIYFYTITAKGINGESFKETKKMLLLK